MIKPTNKSLLPSHRVLQENPENNIEIICGGKGSQKGGGAVALINSINDWDEI